MSKRKTIEKTVLTETPSETGVKLEGQQIAEVPVVELVKIELTAEQASELKALELTISSESRSFVKVGRALRSIDDKRLYRETFSTFADYCPAKWGFTDKHAYRLIHGAQVVDALVAEFSPIGETRLPGNEAQVRPLADLDPTLWVPIWKKVLEKAGTQSITERLVSEVVDQEQAEAPAGPRKKSKKANPKAVAKAKLKQVSSEIKGLKSLLKGSEYSGILKLLNQAAKAIDEHLATLTQKQPA